MGSKSQVCEGGSEGMAADLNVQVAQVFAAWLDETSAKRQRLFTHLNKTFSSQRCRVKA